MQRFLVTAGVLLLAVGLAWPWVRKLPLGRLPGDIAIRRDGFGFYFPLTSMLLVSVVATLLFWLLRRRG